MAGMDRLSFLGFYRRVFRDAWEAAKIWVRDNVFVAGVMATVPAIAIYLADHSHAIDWPVMRLTLCMYAGLLILYYAFHLIRAPWLLHRSKEEQLIAADDERDSYAAKLREIEDDKPEIVQAGAVVEPIGFGIQGSMTPYFTAEFVKMRFVNKPKGNSERAIARAVRAKIKFIDSDSKALLLEIDGRWDSTDQPSTRQYGTTRNDLLPMNFGIEEAQQIDIAFWDAGIRKFVGFNNDSYNFALYGYKKPGYELSAGPITAEIRLVGIGVNKTFSMTFGTDLQGRVVLL
jgi:hypothetical protein